MYSLMHAKLLRYQETQLTEKYGKGYELSSLYKYVKFYKLYPDISDLSSPKSSSLLTWTHYRELIRVEDGAARQWYEEEQSEKPGV